MAEMRLDSLMRTETDPSVLFRKKKHHFDTLTHQQRPIRLHGPRFRSRDVRLEPGTEINNSYLRFDNSYSFELISSI